MPRGRLPAGIVATTAKEPPLITVMSPDFSLETKISYGFEFTPAANAGPVTNALATNAPARRECMRPRFTDMGLILLGVLCAGHECNAMILGIFSQSITASTTTHHAGVAPKRKGRHPAALFKD